MNKNDRPKELPIILIAEDAPDDRYLFEQTFHLNDVAEDLFFVIDGEKLLDFLLGQGQYAGNGPAMDAVASGR